MAKKIEELLVELKINGLEKVEKLSGSFRELSKVTKLNDRDIQDIRQRLIEFGNAAGDTQQANKGLTEAFRGLLGQARRGSAVWTQLVGDLQGFEQASRRTDEEIQTLRRGILTIASGANQSQKSLRDYISELAKLRSEASITGATFGELGQDIGALTGRLQQAEAQTVQTSRTFGRVLGQALASTSAGVRVQLQALRDLINEQRQAIDSVDSLAARERNLTANRTARAEAEERLNRALARQRQLSYGESIRSGRETARTGAAAFNDPEFFSFETIRRRFGDLPNTTAGLNQELSELSERLANTTRGSNLYVETSNRMAQVMRELRRELTGTASTLDTLARSQAAAQRQMSKHAGVQQYYAPTDLLPPAIGGYRDPRTGAMIATGAGPFPTAPQAEAYPQPIGPQQFPEAGRRAQEQIERSLDDVNRIYENSKVQRAEIQAKYDQVYLDRIFELADKETRLNGQIFDKQVADFDRKLEARDRKRRGRLTASQAVQSAGAVISGGIFGGPEGFAGGLGGFAAGLAIPGLGPVGGAFAGAAVGAQVGAFRQAMGAAATYAAEVRRLELALQGVVYSFEDYKTALGAIESTSQQFNIPIQQSTQQFTRLSAAVIGSGGTIKDAENTFKGITASILATGGSVQDVNGALLAASQVFSKGKVSAEELRQQIGERLAGAFALFAESSGKSTQQLDKDLQRGEVTLAQFVKFVEFSLAKYGQTAKIIAASPEQAGARLDLALKNMQRNVGDALGPTGAAFQDFATESIKALDGLILKLIELKAVQPGAGFYISQVLTKQLSMGELESMLLKAGGAEESARAKSGLVGDLGNFLAAYVPGIRAASKEAAILQEALIKLRLIEKQTNKDKKAARDEEAAADQERLGQSYLQAVEQRENSIAQARIELEEQARNIRKQAIEQAQQLERNFADQRLQKERDIAAVRRQLAGVEQDIGFETQAISVAAQGGDPEIVRIQQRVSQAARQRDEERISREQKLLDEQTERSKSIEGFKKTNADAINEANTRYAKAIGDAQREYARAVARIIEEGSGRAGKRLEAAGRIAAALLQQATAKQSFLAATGASIVPSSQGFVVGGVEYSAAELVATAQATGGAAATAAKDFIVSTAAIRDAEQALASLPTATAIAGPAIGSISVNVSDLTARLDRSSQALANLGQQFNNVSEDIQGRKFFKDFLAEAGQATQGAFGTLRSMQQDASRSSAILGMRESGIGAQQAEQAFDLQRQFDEARARLRQVYESAFGATETVGEKLALEEAFTGISSSLEQAEQQVMSFVDAVNNIPTDIQLRLAVQNTKDELAALTNSASQIVGAANAIGSSFGNAFKGLVSGSMSAKEALASFFQSTADYFLDMASKIITQWITMTILNSALKLFPGGAGAAGGGLAGSSLPGGFANPLVGAYTNANGNAFAANGIVPYAKGGIVNSPTLFKFAKGGAMQTGIMGEAGAEAVMPLKRGPDGKLGVAATGGGGVNVVVNVDAKGSAVQGDQGQGNELGRAIAGAVQAELIKQQRPGGLLTR